VEKAIESVLTADISAATSAVVRAGVAEAHRQATIMLPWPATEASESEGGRAADKSQHQLAWQLTSLRIELAAGLDAFEEVVLLRRAGATWAAIAQAAGTSRQAAHERWGARVLAVLDRYGDGQLGGPVADDDPPLSH
jgi:hypothetical protein